MSVFSEVCDFLDRKGIPYRTVHHQPTTTSEESAAARGEDLAIGGKAIVVKMDDTYLLCVISASQKIDSKKMKAHCKAKSMRFATPEELYERTGLVPGSVPPFGRPILDLDLYVDDSIMKNDTIAFNAGSLTDSIIMNVSDYVSVAKPVQFNFSRT